MEADNLDERIFALPSRENEEVIEGLGILDSVQRSLAGIYLSWHKRNTPRGFIQEISDYFGEAFFSTLDKKFPPGLVCRMKVSGSYLRQLSEETRDYNKIRLSLLEIKANNPKPTLALYYDTARMYWAYKPIMPLSYQNTCIETASAKTG